MKKPHEVRPLIIEDPSHDMAVNWNEYRRYMEKNIEALAAAVQKLHEAGFLTYSEEGEFYEVVDFTFSHLNPRLPGAYSYFRREKDAVEYARVMYPGRPWQVRRIKIVATAPTRT